MNTQFANPASQSVTYRCSICDEFFDSTQAAVNHSVSTGHSYRANEIRDQRLGIGRYSVKDQVQFEGLERYAGLRVHGAPGVHAAIFAQMRKMVPPPAHILDLACGEGALSKRFIDAGYTMTAVDLVDDKCRIKNEAKFVQANLNQDFADRLGGPFDGIIASEIIEHLENPRHFMREVGKLLKPNAWLVLSTPNVDSPFSKAVFLRTGYHRGFSPYDYTESGHITPMALECIKRILGETGFKFSLALSAGGETAGNGWWKMRAMARLIAPLSDPDLRQQCLIVLCYKQ